MKQVITFNNKYWPLPKKEEYKGLKVKAHGGYIEVGIGSDPRFPDDLYKDIKYSLDYGETWTKWVYRGRSSDNITVLEG